MNFLSDIIIEITGHIETYEKNKTRHLFNGKIKFIKKNNSYLRI